MPIECPCCVTTAVDSARTRAGGSDSDDLKHELSQIVITSSVVPGGLAVHKVR